MAGVILGSVSLGLISLVLVYELKYYLSRLKEVAEGMSRYRPPYRDLTRWELVRVIATPRLAMRIEQAYADFRISWHLSGEANFFEGIGYNFAELKRLEINVITRGIIHTHRNSVFVWWRERNTANFPWNKINNQTH